MADILEKLTVGRIGDYVLVRLIGRGTQYSLFQAVDPRVGRMVVIKLLHVSTAPEAGPDAAARLQVEGDEAEDVPVLQTSVEPAHVLEARLHREAETLSRLSHPNIPVLYETGEEGGFSFLVSEYLYGHPLRQILDQKALPLGESLAILEQLADAIDAVHAQGILHRDIRPSSVIILHDGRVKLTDFGLARQPTDATVTLMGTLVGEPAYMAPEQLRDKPASPESDIWALGVLLYEMAAGRPPFQGANFPLIAHQVLMAAPAPVPGVSPAVQAVLDRALEKDPEKRYHQARDLVAALRKAAGNEASVPTPLTPRVREPQIRTGFLVGACALGLAAALAILALSDAASVRPARLAPAPAAIVAPALPSSPTTAPPSLIPVSAPAPPSPGPERAAGPPLPPGTPVGPR